MIRLQWKKSYGSLRSEWKRSLHRKASRKPFLTSDESDWYPDEHKISRVGNWTKRSAERKGTPISRQRAQFMPERHSMEQIDQGSICLFLDCIRKSTQRDVIVPTLPFVLLKILSSYMVEKRK